MQKGASSTSRREFLKYTGALAVAAAAGGTAAAGENVSRRSATKQILGFPFRQVHLDCHTSEHIEGVGDDFDPDQLAEMLVRAHVNSVTCFGRCIYFAHPIFTQYNQNAPRWCKRLVLNALDILLPQPLLRHDGPSNTIATITEQPQHKRWVVHLLNYIPERRGEEFDTIEDIIPIHDLRVSVRAPGGVEKVSLVPQKKSLEFKQAMGQVEFTVPKVVGHQMIKLRLS